MHTDKTPLQIKIDERNHVEKPLLDQLNRGVIKSAGILKQHYAAIAVF